MTPSTRKTFRVYFSTWQCFEVIVEADDANDAEEKAQEILDCEGTDGFRLCNTGTDDFLTAEPVQN